MTPAVPRCVFLIHLPLAGTPLSLIIDHVSSCTSLLTPTSLRELFTLALAPLTWPPPAAQAPARALYKEVRGQRSVATPHTAFIFLALFLFSFLFLCFFCASRTLYAPLCASVFF